MTERTLQPKYKTGSVVEYTDRHGRICRGKVRSIDGHWWEGCEPYLIYRLQHPTYRDGNFYCAEDKITGNVKVAKC